jgi:hypothetical protein
MRFTATKIFSWALLLSGIFFIVGYGQMNFLSSSVVEASLTRSETPENELIRIRLDRENLVADKKEKIEEKQVITIEQKKLTEKIQKIEGSLLGIKKMIDKINADIGGFPAPDLEKIEIEYRQIQSQENERYEKQKIATQKLYVDTMNLIQQAHDERVKKGWKSNEVIMAEDELAATNRHNALKSLTDANIEQRAKHEDIVQDIEEQKQQALSKAKTDNQSLLAPLIQQKQSITEEKTRLQEERDALIVEQTKNNSKAEDIVTSIDTIESTLAALDYKILLLEETVLRNIVP